MKVRLSELPDKIIKLLKNVGKWFYEINHQAAFGHIRNLLIAQKAVFGQALLPISLVSTPVPLTVLRILPFAEEELIYGLFNLENRDFLAGLDAFFDGV